MAGTILLLAASVLFAALMIADRAGPLMGTIALLNAAIFCLRGVGCLRYVWRPWQVAGTQGKPAPLDD